MILEHLQDVIVAHATPPGRSALAIVRVSGPQALRMCDQIFHGKKRLSDIASHRVTNGYIRKGEQIIDEVMAAVFRSPRSYTTEDMVEFFTHGNPIIVEQVMALLLGLGARVAQPGEFTQRAYLHGRIDITQVEAVLAAIETSTIEGVSAAISQLSGKLSAQFTKIETSVRSLYAFLEAQLEFPEEDISLTDAPPIEAVLDELIKETEELMESFRRGRTKRKGLTVMLLGRPNVGKSTLFNALLGDDRSIVTSVPGTTRDLVTGTLRFPEGRLRLFDAAGIGVAEALPDKIAVKRAIGAANRADFLLLLLDSTTGLLPADEELLKLIKTKPGVVVWNKIDAVRRIPALSDDIEQIKISALKQKNLQELLDRFRKEVSVSGKTFYANRFQEERLKNLSQNLYSARKAPYLDMQAKELREALEIISGVERPDLTNMVLDDIFSRFCIGK